jgi:hypothetical protein
LAKTVNVTVSSEEGPRETAAVKVLLDHQAGGGYAAYVTYHDQGGKTVADNVIYDELKERFFPPPEKAYLVRAFLPSAEPPSAEEAKAYLLEGALFDPDPVISIRRSFDGVFDEMALNFDPERQPMILRRLSGEDAEAARVRAAGEASRPGGKQIKAGDRECPTGAGMGSRAISVWTKMTGSHCAFGRPGSFVHRKAGSMLRAMGSLIPS